MKIKCACKISSHLIIYCDEALLREFGDGLKLDWIKKNVSYLCDD